LSGRRRVYRRDTELLWLLWMLQLFVDQLVLYQVLMPVDALV